MTISTCRRHGATFENGVHECCPYCDNTDSGEHRRALIGTLHGLEHIANLAETAEVHAVATSRAEIAEHTALLLASRLYAEMKGHRATMAERDMLARRVAAGGTA